MYLLSLILGVPGLAALLFLEIGARSGISFRGAPIPTSLLVEAISVVAAVGLFGASLAQARQRRADGWNDYAGPAPLLVGGALLALITGLSLPLEYGLAQAGVRLGTADSTMLHVLLYLTAYVGVVHFIVVKTGALTWRDIVRPRRLAPSQDDWAAAPQEPEFVDALGRRVQSWRSRIALGAAGDILLALAMLLPLFFVSVLLSALLSVALGLHESDISSPVTTTVTDFERWITMLAVAILVPLGEEIFYRGFATNAWGRSLSRNSTILRGALFFATVHVINVTSTNAGLSFRAAVFNMAVRIPVAIALTWIYMRRRSLVASATLHGSYNALIVILGILASY